jgi:peroxiredoxin
VLLAGILAAAGVAKLADLAGSRRAVRDFGVPAGLAAPVGTLLPLVEIGVGAALLFNPSATWAAAAALALLLAFVGVVAVALARGREPECHCFGQLHSSPISGRTLLRNGALAVIAAIVLWRGVASPDSCALGCVSADLTPWVLVAGAVALVVGLAAAQWWLLINLVRQNGRLLARLKTLEARIGGDPARDARSLVGDPAPPFQLPDGDGAVASLAELMGPARPLLLLFSDPGCTHCATLPTEVAALARSGSTTPTVVMVSRRRPAEAKDRSGAVGRVRMLLDESGHVFDAYRVPGTPSAALITPDGTIRDVASGIDDVRKLLHGSFANGDLHNGNHPALLGALEQEGWR